MEKKSSNLLKKYLKSRKKVLSERPVKIKVFLEEIIREIGDASTIIVFGGRGDPSKLFSTEPRDLDLLIITRSDKDYVEEKISRLRPKGLTLDVIVININEYREQNKLLKKILEKSIIIHDGLMIFGRETRK
ncbi:MAG: hypothetical protein B6U89_05900 [Desulfurococcales archaeon ex4484_58]|nr:MAG: hypothetical protein B6U89_05900 [Desulfurococcales archaeon ex4484_58]